MKKRIINALLKFLSFRTLVDDIEDLKKLNENFADEGDEFLDGDIRMVEQPYVSIKEMDRNFRSQLTITANGYKKPQDRFNEDDGCQVVGEAVMGMHFPPVRAWDDLRWRGGPAATNQQHNNVPAWIVAFCSNTTIPFQ